jgi:hypothetical protein
MKLISKEITKEQITPYWGDNSLSVKDYTSINKFLKGGYEIELKQELGHFTNTPEKIIIYRTYIKIIKEGRLVKKRLFYGDNGTKWKQFVTEIIGE